MVHAEVVLCRLAFFEDGQTSLRCSSVNMERSGANRAGWQKKRGLSLIILLFKLYVLMVICVIVNLRSCNT
jgi:hypothetical protein